MVRTSIFFLAVLLPWLGFAQKPTPELIEKTTAQIASITGMAIKRPVPFQTITREDWKKWVDEEIRRTVKPAEIRAEELVLRRFGLIPETFDLRQATVDMLGEQAAAVYDHRRKRMLFVEGAAEGELGEAVLVHELSHAVADQHFDMTRFLDKGAPTDEAQTARMAVVEGQAMWIMIESQYAKAGMSLKGNATALEMILPSMGKMAEQSYPVFAKAPLYLRETLLFPYSAGLRFQQAVLDKLGQAGFAEILRRPPSSTAQILHPDTYFQNRVATRPPLPALDGVKEFAKLTDGSLGELNLRILIRQYIGEPESLEHSPKLRGGSFDLMEHKKDKRAVLRWSSEWDSEASARAFFDLYRKIAEKKSARYEAGAAADKTLEGRNEYGRLHVVWDGVRVSGLEGF